MTYYQAKQILDDIAAGIGNHYPVCVIREALRLTGDLE
jgi:hypothetical protein